MSGITCGHAETLFTQYANAIDVVLGTKHVRLDPEIVGQHLDADPALQALQGEQTACPNYARNRCQLAAGQLCARQASASTEGKKS